MNSNKTFRSVLFVFAAGLSISPTSAYAQSFTVSPGLRSSVIVPQGGAKTYAITVAPTGGFSNAVTFSASGLPAGVTASFSPASSTTSTTLTLTAGAGAALGTKDITITGTSGALVKTTAIEAMVTAGDTGAAFTWPSYNPDLNFDFKTTYPDLSNPTGILNDTANIAGTHTSDGSWHFRHGPNKNGLITSAAWKPMLNRLNYDFAWFRDNLGWPADLRHRSGYFSAVYLFGSGLGTDTAANTDRGGWQSATNYQGINWPMILMSYYPVYSFDPNCPYGDRVEQQGATVHEGIHAMFADAPGVKQAAWFHEGGNTFLQGEQAAQLSGNYNSMGWLSATSALAPFMPIETYSGWLQDGSFGGPGAEGVNQGSSYGSTWRRLFGGVQYSESFPHFLHEMVSPGSVGWIWQNCPGRVLEGLAGASGGLGRAQMRRLIMEYRARMALCDMGKWSGAYQRLLNDNWNASLGPEYTPYWIQSDAWTATCYQPTTNSGGVLTPQAKTLPGWSGANYVPLTTNGAVGSTVSIDFNPLGNSQIITANSGTSSVPEATTATSNNMTCQLVYRAADGSVVYGQPVSGGTCSVRLDKATRDGVIIAVIANTDFIYTGEDSRKRKYDYRLTLGSGMTGTASVNTKWYQTTVQPALKAVAGNGENYVFWGAVSGATSYTLKRATTPGGPYSNVFTGPNLEYRDAGRVNGTTYYYIATASNGTQTSANSNEAVATPFATAVTIGNSSFESPSGTGSVANPTGASWTFTGVSGVTHQTSTYASGNRQAPVGVKSGFLQNKATISQTVSGFTPGASYTIRFLASQRQADYQLGNIFDLRVDGRIIRSFFPLQQGSTWGEFTASFTATAPTQTISFNGTNANGGTNMVLLDRVLIVRAAAATIPAIPGNLSAVATAATVDLAWKVSPLAVGYTVKRSTTSGSGFTTLAANVTGLSYSDTTAVPGTVYYYVVTASNPQGESPISNQVTACRSAELQVHLKFDQSSGTTAADSSGNGRTGVVTAGTWTAGKSGNAVSLSGSSSYVALPAGSIRALNDYTIATWVKLNSISTFSRIFDFGSGTGTYMLLTPQYSASKPGILRFQAKVPNMYPQVMDSSVAITSGVWTHVAITQSGPVAKLYLNGMQAAVCPSMPLVPASLGNTTQNYIGKSQYSTDPYLNGSIDDFRIYNRALSGGELATLAGTYTGKTLPVAYWNFEEGTADAAVLYAPPNGGYYDGSIRDLCGGENNLSAWATNWGTYRALVPLPTTPSTGAANTRSLQNSNATPGLSTTDTPLITWSPAKWTLEAAIRPDAVTGTQTIIGRDSQGAYATDPGLAALSFAVRPNGVLAVQYTDATGKNWKVESAAGSVSAAKWQAVAAASDGSTLKIYLRNLTDNAPAYTLLGSVNITSSNPAITTGDGDGTNWDAGVFTVGRGLYNGSHTDRFLGHLDDIRFSERALGADELLYSVAPAAPTSLNATPIPPNGINLSWIASPGATSYTVKRSTTPGGSYVPIATDLTTTTHSDLGLAAGAAYYYIVTAKNIVGESNASAEAGGIPALSRTPAEIWRQAHFGTTVSTGPAADGEDPDRDGLVNLLERALGGNPNASESGILPVPDPSAPHFSILYRKSTAATDLEITVQQGDLTNEWTTAIGTSEIVEEIGASQLVRFTIPSLGIKKRFLRISVMSKVP